MYAWPVVCIAVSATSKLRALSRSRISMHTAARASAPASRHAGTAACIAGSSTSGSTCS